MTDQIETIAKVIKDTREALMANHNAELEKNGFWPDHNWQPDDRDIARAILSVLTEWQPIDTAPKDGTVIDLWIQSLEDGSGADDVHFWCSGEDFFDKKHRIRCGRITGFIWAKKGPNPPGWFPIGGLKGFPLSVRPTHWMPRPEPPKE
jgi:hypothetical protein